MLRHGRVNPTVGRVVPTEVSRLRGRAPKSQPHAMRASFVVSLWMLGACGFPSLDLSEHPCPCDDGFVCDEARDRCVRSLDVDGGARDGGGGVDGGDVDGGGVDGGGVDGGGLDGGGFDGGVRTDGGLDGGFDAGPMTPGESCYAPLPLTLSGGRAHADGSLGGFEPTYDTSCETGLGGRDLVYVIELGEGTFDVDISTTPSSLDTVVAASADCDGLSSDTFLGCNDDWTPSYRGSHLIAHRWPGPRIYVLVKGHETGTTGSFGLDVSVRTAVDTSSCGTTMDLSNGGTVLAMPRAGTGAFTTSCGGSGMGVEDVYLLSTDPGGYDFVFGDFGNTFRALALVDSCSAGRTEHWCQPAMRIGPDWGTRGYSVAVPGSPSYLIVDGAPTDGGEPYSIRFSP